MTHRLPFEPVFSRPIRSTLPTISHSFFLSFFLSHTHSLPLPHLPFRSFLPSKTYPQPCKPLPANIISSPPFAFPFLSFPFSSPTHLLVFNTQTLPLAAFHHACAITSSYPQPNFFRAWFFFET